MLYVHFINVNQDVANLLETVIKYNNHTLSYHKRILSVFIILDKNLYALVI